MYKLSSVKHSGHDSRQIGNFFIVHQLASISSTAIIYPDRFIIRIFPVGVARVSSRAGSF